MASLLSNATPTKAVAILNISQALFEAEIQTHIIHLQQPSLSLAVHETLGDFYSGLGDLNDELVEKYQGKYTIVRGYKSMNISEISDPLPYIQSLLDKIEYNRQYLKEGYLEQLTDNIIEFISKTLFKLKYVK